MNDEDIEINGIPFNDIIDAIDLLQKADLDTSSVNMSLTHAIGKIEEEEDS